MFKLGFVCLGLVSMILAAPVDDSASPVPILKQAQDGPNPDGSYSYSYETGNGIQSQEQGSFVATGKEEGIMKVQGSFRFTSENGTVYEVTYIADENGYQPQGAHLPTPPPIPAEIQKSLDYIKAHPEENDVDAPKN